MAWKAIDRITPAADDGSEPLLDEAVKEKIRAFFPRYPSKRAVLLPALHIVQNTYGHVSHRAMRDIAELLEIPPSQVLDTITFYTHFWTHHKGRKVIVACRSLSCALLGAGEVQEAITRNLGIDEHGTTEDGAYSFVTEECLGACEHAPCLLINEKLHKRVKAEDVPRLLADADNDKVDMPRSSLYDGPSEAERQAARVRKPAAGQPAAEQEAGKMPAPLEAGRMPTPLEGGQDARPPEMPTSPETDKMPQTDKMPEAAPPEARIGRTSDVREMRES